MKRKVIQAMLVVSTVLSMASSLLVAPRDGFLTAGIPSYSPSEIINNRYWTEGPVQVLNTFMADNTHFIGLGKAGSGGVNFAERLVLSFSEGTFDTSTQPLDLRKKLDQKRLSALNKFVQTMSYRSSFPCPHDANQICTIAVGWNRERRREKGMTMIVARVSELTYLIADDSIFGLSDK